MELITPCEKYKNIFINALKDGFYSGSGGPKSPAKIAEIENDFSAYLQKILPHEDDTPHLRDDGKYYVNVPSFTYWLIDNDEFIGIFTLRTDLNNFLVHMGGNVGYRVHPKYRCRGYATRGLSLIIEKAKEKGMKKLLIIAAEGNIASCRAIEKNGGVLEDIAPLPWEKSGEKYKRYWIEI